jgi:hypothetical protein
VAVKAENKKLSWLVRELLQFIIDLVFNVLLPASSWLRSSAASIEGQ